MLIRMAVLVNSLSIEFHWNSWEERHTYLGSTNGFSRRTTIIGMLFGSIDSNSPPLALRHLRIKDFSLEELAEVI